MISRFQTSRNVCLFLSIVVGICVTILAIQLTKISIPESLLKLSRCTRASLIKDINKLNNNSSPFLFITLSFGDDPFAKRVVTHNCLKLKQLNTSQINRFIIYTDNISQKPYCSKCECREFKKYECECAGDNKKKCKRRNACEKLFFITDIMNEFKQFTWLDHDLIILKDSFVNSLITRSTINDFLATRAHSQLENPDYWRFFNSGLFFIRRLSHVNHMVLRDWLYTRNDVNRDQRIFSTFIHEKYDNWDELSYKWNCRFMDRQTIPIKHCYTLHEGEERVGKQLEELNFTLLTISGVSDSLR